MTDYLESALSALRPLLDGVYHVAKLETVAGYIFLQDVAQRPNGGKINGAGLLALAQAARSSATDKSAAALCEEENDRLRALLRWAAERLSDADRSALGDMTERGAEFSVVEDGEPEEDLREAGLLLDEVADLIEAWLDEDDESCGDPSADYQRRFCRLAERCRALGPKNPIMSACKNEDPLLRKISKRRIR